MKAKTPPPLKDELIQISDADHGIFYAKPDAFTIWLEEWQSKNKFKAGESK